jgi:hypothetical protein
VDDRAVSIVSLSLVGRLAFSFSSIKVAHVPADVATMNPSGIVRQTLEIKND